MAKIHNIDNIKCWQGYTITEVHCWECIMVQPFWKRAWQFLIKRNIILQCNLIIFLLEIYLKKLKSYVKQKAEHKTALFIIVQTWRPPKCCSVGEEINIQLKMEKHLVLKRNELLSHEKTRKNLKCILLSQRNKI